MNAIVYSTIFQDTELTFCFSLFFFLFLADLKIIFNKAEQLTDLFDLALDILCTEILLGNSDRTPWGKTSILVAYTRTSQKSFTKLQLLILGRISELLLFSKLLDHTGVLE